ncbi:MAG: cobalt ECF transporter T component CbiQ [Planctomycetota bacterium]|nr:cobalt ECF transporter T component CbiQ [Planctomycetota bacterium]
MSGSHASGELHAHGALLWLDPRAKIVSLFAVVFVAISTPAEAWQAFAAYWALLTLYALVGAIPPRQILRRLILVIPFVLLVLLVQPLREPDFSKGEYWVEVLGMQVSSGGLAVLANVALKSLTSVYALILLSATTPFNDMLRGFERLYVPTVFVEIAAFAWRYLFVLRDEAQRMLRARDARAWKGRWLWQAWVIGLMVGSLFLRAYERAERVYQAMKARGYYGQSHTHFDRSMTRPDWGLIVLFAAVLAATRTWVWQTL